MSSATLTPLDEYLSKTYDPDREYAGGNLIERNVGTQLHGLLQSLLAEYLRGFRKSHKITVFTETRLLVDATKRIYRIPDVMVVERPYQRGRFVVDVPSATIEIKSPDDTFDDVYGKCLEYDALGVPSIIVIDPDHRRQHVFEHDRLRSVDQVSISLRSGMALSLPPAAKLFAELDDEDSE